jgi:hypothetical protein
LLDKGLTVFDIVSPISTKEIKAVGNILGVADNLNDAKKAGGKAGEIAKGTEKAKGGVYVLKEGETVVRSGRTSDLSRREAEHAKDATLGKYKFETKHRTPTQRNRLYPNFECGGGVLGDLN